MLEQRLALGHFVSTNISIFEPYVVRANGSQGSTRANSKHLRLCLLQTLWNLNQEVILQIFRTFSASDFEAFPPLSLQICFCYI